MSTDSGSSNAPQFPTFSITKNLRMPPEDKALYERVALLTDPTSITRAEKNQLDGLPPPDEEDRLCVEKVGLTMAELKDKVAVSHVTLTQEEADIILFGVTWEPGNLASGKRYLLWSMDLINEERQLVEKVQISLGNPYDNAINRLASKRWDELRQLNQPVREQKREQKAQEMRAAFAAQREAGRPKWVQEMLAAKLAHWGFVIFRTDYHEGTDKKWHVFKGIYRMTAATVLRDCWSKANTLVTTQKSLLVSDSELDGASLDTLRQRFKRMRENGEIPSGRATDCFLVVDRAALDHDVISTKTLYKPKSPGEADPWDTTLSLRAVDPDYKDTDALDSEGYIRIPLPKVFDWLYYCFMFKSEDWKMRYVNTKGGPAEVMDPDAPYPAYRSGMKSPLP
ncbi:hypothetical protein BELL_0797g00030 [Botrytis elliptica]|uniref:Uncharacterized protein n=1 Tax=Botrytis elliptica TaxID=278938 RepID=A0A4Z1J5X6_9HELO|nr:hypothetical protein EAE99_003732 [Botrytis elliptica]TGO68991.1 hypothetical protein BELL_0797g00030 [Botrytis elliptica]